MEETKESLPPIRQGSCLCGQVQYQTDGTLGDVCACHCTQCRKTTGHFFATTDVQKENFKLIKESGLRWYQSSEGIKRGFCQYCGSSLFWENEESKHISILAGTLDGRTGLKMKHHIFTEFKGDYYELNDDVPIFHGDNC